MKKIYSVLFVALATQLMLSCSKEPTPTNADFTASITFFTEGDFEWRRDAKDMTADGYNMTDLWVFDYVGNTLVQTIHQDDNSASDFGSPTIDLAYGTHTLYFVASRGNTPTVNTTSHSISWVKPYDTFWKAYDITVSASTSSASAQTVTLDRVVTKLYLTFTDVIPTNAATFTITPTTWYYGLDYTTGNPTDARTSQEVVVNIPANCIGQANQHSTLFGFSGTTEWTTNLAIASHDGNGNLIGQASIPNAPFVRNRATEYSGALWSATGGSWGVNLNTNWGNPYQGSW